MAAYILADVRITDTKQYDGYRKLSREAFRVRGVQPLARGRKTERPEGREPGRVVVPRFESADAAKAFHDAPEYRAARQDLAFMK